MVWRKRLIKIDRPDWREVLAMHRFDSSLWTLSADCLTQIRPKLTTTNESRHGFESLGERAVHQAYRLFNHGVPSAFLSFGVPNTTPHHAGG